MCRPSGKIKIKMPTIARSSEVQQKVSALNQELLEKQIKYEEAKKGEEGRLRECQLASEKKKRLIKESRLKALRRWDDEKSQLLKIEDEIRSLKLEKQRMRDQEALRRSAASARAGQV